MVHKFAMATKRKSVPKKGKIRFGVAQAYFLDLCLYAGDDDFQKVLPTGAMQLMRYITRYQLGSRRQYH